MSVKPDPGGLSARILWGNLSPFALLPGAALLFVASDRLSHALLTLAALVWVYGLSALAVSTASRFLPERGRTAVFAFTASFAASLYLLPVSLLFPLAALQVFFAVALVPVLCAGSGVLDRAAATDPASALRLAATEALVAGSLVVILSLIREPLGFRSLSLPGGSGGILMFYPFGENSPLYLRLLSGVPGALLLLAYALGAYRHFRSKHRRGDD